MNVLLLLEMAVSADPDRIAVGRRGSGLTYSELYRHAGVGASLMRRSGVRRMVYVAPNHDAYPVAVFAAARAGTPLVPINYRLAQAQIENEIGEHSPALVVATGAVLQSARAAGRLAMTPGEWLEATRVGDLQPSWTESDADEVALILYTSGTTSTPKQAILRHRHLVSYVTATVEFNSARVADAALVSMPPYHIAGYSSVLSNVYAGRRIVELESFSPDAWLATVRDEKITNAVLVPTMLARITQSLQASGGTDLPTLRSLAYGGARMPANVIECALDLLPTVDFVNAYGLTETSSTVAVLGAEDHRAAATSDDPVVRARLGSVGRVVPGVEVEVRAPSGHSLAQGESGEIWLRGEQISGEYIGQDRVVDDHGWYPTRDRGHVDVDGYLFIEGRADDTIIRGGENIAPEEIEDVILRHPAVADVAVVGATDEDWGQRIVAVVVLKTGEHVDPDELREWIRATLRSSRTPDTIIFRDALPRTATGKLLRRDVVAGLP